MLNQQQIKFRDDFLSPWKQRFFYLKNLPMVLFSGTRVVCLDEEKSIAEVPFKWRNKNPFHSVYFAVQSMAAELSTAAPVFLALKGVNASTALIIVDIKADFAKKAQSKITFTCLDYEKITAAVEKLKYSGDISIVTAKTTGVDVLGDEVATFYFTWSFKRR